MTAINEIRIWLAGNMPEVKVFDIESIRDYKTCGRIVKMNLAKPSDGLTQIQFAILHNQSVSEALDHINLSIREAMKLIDDNNNPSSGEALGPQQAPKLALRPDHCPKAGSIPAGLPLNLKEPK